MGTEAQRLASLALLLHAEQRALGVPDSDLLRRYDLNRRFQPRRAALYADLSQALVTHGSDNRADLADMPAAGPVLIACDSLAFQPDLDSLRDQVLLRLLAGLGQAGLQGWILRTRPRPRSLKGLLARLSARPSAVIAAGLSEPACLELLQGLAPLTRFGPRSAAVGQVPCVEYDAQLEAVQIASCAAAARTEHIAFIGMMDNTSGMRRMNPADFAVLSALVVQAQNRHIGMPGGLTFWLDAGRDLQSAGIAQRLTKHGLSRVLAVASGPGPAGELARAAGGDTGHIICRHWSADGPAGVRVIGPDPDQVARVVLARALGRDGLPPEAAVLVPPAWHR